jgi:hypothetical protein
MPVVARAIQFHRGVNLLKHPSALGDDELVESRNLFPTNAGRLAKRPTAKKGEAPDSGGGPAFQAIINPFDGSRAAYFNGGGVHLSGTNDLVFSGADYLFAGTMPNEVSFLAWRNKIYCFPGYTQAVSGLIGQPKVPPVATYPFTSSEWVNFAFNGTGNAAVCPSLATIYKRRFVFANFGPGYENYILFSDPDDPQTIGNDALAANGRSFRVAPDDGDYIVAVLEITQTSVGSPAQSALLVLRRNSAFIVNGEPNLTTDTGDMLASLNVSRINIDIGCAAKETIVRTEHGTFWASDTDVWCFESGQLPRKVGTKISPLFKNTPAQYRYQWHAGYINGVYRLAIGSDGQSFSPRSGTGGSSHPMGEQWWLDVRDGAPQDAESARWYGPQVYKLPNIYTADDGTYCMAVETRPANGKHLYIIWADPSRAQFFLVDEDTSYDAGQAIESSLISKEYDFGDPGYTKNFQRSEVVLSADKRTNLKVTAILDRKIVQEIQKQYDPAGFVLGTDRLDAAAAMNISPQGLSFFPPVRVPCRVMQILTEDVKGYVVDDTNDVLAFVDSGSGVVIPVNIRHDTYNLVDLMDEVVGEMQGYTSSIYSHNVTTTDIQTQISSDTEAFGPAVEAEDGDITMYSVTEEQFAKSKRLWNLMGFLTPVSQAPALTADTVMPFEPVSHIEYDGLVIRGSVTPRSP